MNPIESKKKCILLVEDEEEIRGMLKEQIQALGSDYAVIESKDGMDARTRLDNQAFQCILTDLNMPRLTGQGVIKYARSSRLNSTTPIVVVTAFPDPRLLAEYEYLLLFEKPFDPKELLKTLVDQIRLGPTDQRIPIQLFNVFLASLNEWAEKEGFNPQMLSPKPKTGLPDMNGDIYLFTRYQFFQLKPWLGVGMQKEFIDKYPGSEDARAKCLKISDGIWSLIKKNALPIFNRETFNLIEKLVCDKAELNGFATTNFRGITVPLQTKNGILYAEALVGKVDLRKGR